MNNPTPEEIDRAKEMMREAGRILGRARSPRKTAAARRNARKRWDDYRKKKARKSSAK